MNLTKEQIATHLINRVKELVLDIPNYKIEKADVALGDFSDGLSARVQFDSGEWLYVSLYTMHGIARVEGTGLKGVPAETSHEDTVPAPLSPSENYLYLDGGI